MTFYNRFKQIVSYLNFIFGIYLWTLVTYAFFRLTGLIKRVALQEHGLGNLLNDFLLFLSNTRRFMLGCGIFNFCRHNKKNWWVSF